MATAAERTLAVEWLAVMLVETGDALAHPKQRYTSAARRKITGLPYPSRYFATMVVYLMLAAGAAFSERFGKVMTALGGLVALTIVLAPPTIKAPISKTNEPLIVSFFGWLASIYQSPPTTITTGTATKVTRSTPGTPSVTRGQSSPGGAVQTGVLVTGSKRPGFYK